MRTIMRRIPRRWLLVAGVVIVACCVSQMAVAIESCLGVHETNGDYHFYDVGEIERITYGENELYVTTAYGTDTYALQAMVRIEFVPGPRTGVDGPRERPVSLVPSHLFQNQPNPFSPETYIAFELPKAGRAVLRVYDVRGRLIRILVNEKRAAGSHSVRWDGRDDTGRVVASGVYFYWLTSPGVDENRKMILAK